MTDRFDSFYMNTAREAAKLSRAVRLKVGSVAVYDRNIIGFGFNGTPPGEPNECEDKVYRPIGANADLMDAEYPLFDSMGAYKLVTKPSVIHAEENVILKIAASNNSTKGATLYVTHSPCIRCARMIHSAGFTRLIYENPYLDDNSPIKLLKSKGIQCEVFDVEQ